MSEMTMNPKTELYKKILAVQKVLEPLEKNGWNEFQKYRYSTAGDVLLPVQRACNEQGLIVLADCIESKIEPGRASVIVRLTVTDTETGESLSVTAPGYAEDYSWKDNRPNGDKAVYKAITGATKYAIRSCFCLPSDDDPERSPQKLTISRPSSRFTSDRSTLETALIEQTTAELKRLGWSSNQGRIYLQEKFGKSSRQQLTEQELQQFLNHLRSLPMPEAPQPVLQ
jgi:hypothetical protein